MQAAIIALALATVAGAVSAQPAPPPAALQNGLFGEREPEPGDEDIAAGQAQPEPTPSTPAGPSAAGYDARVKQSFAAAESFRGPLDGGWTLSAVDGAPLFAIRFSENQGRLEAAWRDLRRDGALNASGLVEAAERDGGRLTLRFAPAAGQQDLATLTATAGGAWKGELEENGRKRAVKLTKTSP